MHRRAGFRLTQRFGLTPEHVRAIGQHILLVIGNMIPRPPELVKFSRVKHAVTRSEVFD